MFTNNTQAQSGRQPNPTNISLQEKLSLVGKPEWNEVEYAHSQPASGKHYKTFPLTRRTKEIEVFVATEFCAASYLKKKKKLIK